MLKEYYKSIEDFYNKNNFKYKSINNEGEIFFKEDLIYKIFYSSTKEKMDYYKNIKNIINISKLDNNYLTIPTTLIYIHKIFSGFAMFNSGPTTLELIKNNQLTIDDKIKIAYQLKDICEYLSLSKYIHGDIKLDNLLYKDNKLLLTDINGMVKKSMKLGKIFQTIRMPKLYLYWCKIFGKEYIDFLEVNYCTYILFNCNSLRIEQYGKDMATKNSYNHLMECENTYFEEDIADDFKYWFEGRNIKELKKKYLIDFLK